MIPTSSFMKITPAVPHATTPAIAIPSSKRCSTSNPWKATKENARGWCGRSKGNWRRTVRGRSSFTSVRILLAAGGKGLDDDGQQHRQQFSYGRRLGRQIIHDEKRGLWDDRPRGDGSALLRRSAGNAAD